MAREPSLNGYLHFEAVARRGNVSKAADELSVSPSAVSQQIKLLEQQLGLMLFRRKGRRLSLTIEGEQLFQASSVAIRILRDVRRHLGKTHESRRLSLRVAPSFGVRWLGPRLSDFLAANPEWDVRIDAAPYPTDFDREVMDLDIRYGLGKWTGFHSMPVTSDFVLPLCSPEYRDALMSKTTDPRGALRSAKLIDSARALCQWDYWLMRNGISDVANHKSILIDRSSMAIQLALDGVGVVLESLTLAAKEVYSGALVPLMPSIGVIAFPAYWMVCPNRYVSRRAVGIFMAWLMESAKTHEREVLDFLQANGLALDKIDGPSELATSNVHSP